MHLKSHEWNNWEGLHLRMHRDENVFLHFEIRMKRKNPCRLQTVWSKDICIRGNRKRILCLQQLCIYDRIYPLSVRNTSDGDQFAWKTFRSYCFKWEWKRILNNISPDNKITIIIASNSSMPLSHAKMEAKFLPVRVTTKHTWSVKENGIVRQYSYSIWGVSLSLGLQMRS